MSHHIHKILKIYSETRLRGRSIPWDMPVTEIVRMAEQEKELFKYNETTFFCCYRTDYEGKPSILILFTMNLPGPASGSSTASEYVIGILSMLERQFTPLADTHFSKEIDCAKKNIGLLRVIKTTTENDIL